MEKAEFKNIVGQFTFKFIIHYLHNHLVTLALLAVDPPAKAKKPRPIPSPMYTAMTGTDLGLFDQPVWCVSPPYYI